MKDTFEFNVQFIELIKNHPCLYDHTRKDYCIRDIQDKTWLKIAKTVQEPVTECKDRWKNIRGRYLKYVKQINEPGAKACKEYYLAEYLPFLDKFYKPRIRNHTSVDDEIFQPDSDIDKSIDIADRTVTQSSDEENPLADLALSPSTYCNIKIEREGDSTISPDFFIAAGKRENTGDDEDLVIMKRKKRSESKIEADPDLMFLKSLLPDMKSMTPEQKRRFKIGVITLCGQVLSQK